MTAAFQQLNIEENQEETKEAEKMHTLRNKIVPQDVSEPFSLHKFPQTVFIVKINAVFLVFSTLAHV